jgi:mono/diheme cytochrome c family protein
MDGNQFEMRNVSEPTASWSSRRGTLSRGTYKEVSVRRAVVLGLVLVITGAAVFGLACSGSKEKGPVGSVENGRILYKKLKCSYCHTIGGEGGTTGPDLTQEGTKNRSIGWQIKNLTDPSSAHPKHGDTSEMPKFDKLTDKMLLDLATYLQSLKE